MIEILYSIMYVLASTTDSLGSNTDGGNATLDPIYNLLTVLLPSAMGIVFAVGTIYGIVLGVQYSKAASADEREKVKKRLISMTIGVVMVIVLLGILFALRQPLTNILS